MKRFFISIISICLCLAFAGCNDYLDYKPTLS